MSISIRNISVGYGSRILMNSVSADVESGALTALLGRNGTGKSTLMRTLCGLGKVNEGSIHLCGKDISTLTPQQTAAIVSFVATDKVRIANLSCEDVVSLGRAPYTNWIGHMQSVDRDIVHHSLQLVGMESFATKTMDMMSDGECQRVMIARALAQDTPIILLDEPTAFLDLPNRYEICTLLMRLAHEQNKCILFSTHDLDIALSLCDSIALIDTPHLHHLPTPEMVGSGHIERLFSSSNIVFDPVSQSVKLTFSADKK